VNEIKMPVLFVDDDAVAHELIDKYLEGRKVHHAYSAEDALLIADTENIPIVVTDIYMEEMDGIELTRKLKKNRCLIQVIVITGGSETMNLLNAMEAGANDFLVKPLTMTKLIEAVGGAEAKIGRWQGALRDIFSRKRGKE
jgi:two-component system response regulator YesN